MNVKKLVFVYNSSSNPLSLLKQGIDEMVLKKPGVCSLCNLTYDGLSKKQDWKAYLKTLPVDIEFQLKDRFEKKYPEHAAKKYPMILAIGESGKMEVFLAADQIDGFSSLDQLKNEITLRLS